MGVPHTQISQFYGCYVPLTCIIATQLQCRITGGLGRLSRAQGKRFRVIDSIFEILTVVLHFESAMVRNMSQRGRKNHQMPKWSRISMEMILMYKSLNFWID